MLVNTSFAEATTLMEITTFSTPSGKLGRLLREAVLLNEAVRLGEKEVDKEGTMLATGTGVTTLGDAEEEGDEDADADADNGTGSVDGDANKDADAEADSNNDATGEGTAEEIKDRDDDEAGDALELQKKVNV
jgi:hypothetical protein